MTATAMFPLGSVLFPHMPLPLRLFEPRYLKMLGDLLETEEPQFAVVLIERGHEVGGGDHRFPVGTLARIVEVAAHADYMAVGAVGIQRVRVREWLPDDPYPQAVTEPLPDLQWDEELAEQFAATEQQVRTALSVSTGAAFPDQIRLSDDPVAASWQLAGITPVGPLDQLRMLEAGSVAELLETTMRLAVESTEVADW